MQTKIDYAFHISGGDQDFVYTLEGENHLWTINRVHNYWYYCPNDGKMHTDYGMGISSCYHPTVTNDPRFKSDWKWHLDQAWRLYSGGTIFYGKQHINKMKKKYTYIPNTAL